MKWFAIIILFIAVTVMSIKIGQLNTVVDQNVVTIKKITTDLKYQQKLNILYLRTFKVILNSISQRDSI